MPISSSTLATADPAVTLPGTVRVTNDLVSTGTGNTRARVTYTLDPEIDVWIANTGTPAKAWTGPAVPVRVAPGTSHSDALSLVRSDGLLVALFEIPHEIQEVDEAGAPVPGEPPLPKSVTVAILGV